MSSLSRFKLTPMSFIGVFMFLVFLSCGGYCIYLDEPFTQVRTWEDVGPIQIIASEKEIWMFLQVDQWKHIPGKLVSAPSRTTGHHQVCVILSDSGVKRTVRVVPDDGPSFSPNLGDIFRVGNNVFLFRGQSLNHPTTLYRWEKDHFQQLLPHEMRQNLRELGLDKKNNPLKDDELPMSQNWSRLVNVRDMQLGPVEFGWNGSTYTLRKKTTESLSELQMHCTAKNGEWTTSLIQFDERRREQR